MLWKVGVIILLPMCFGEYFCALVAGGGATGLAALLQGLLPELSDKKVVVPLCGGNIDTPVLGRVIERGLAADGRLVQFSAAVPDAPGGIAKITALLVSYVYTLLSGQVWLLLLSWESSISGKNRSIYSRHLS